MMQGRKEVIMDFNHILTLIDKVSSKGNISCVEVEENGMRVLVKAEGQLAEPAARAAEIKACAHAGSGAETENAGGQQESVLVPEEHSAADVKVPSERASDLVVTSPLIGTFYASASEGGDPFVKAGDPVKKGQVLGIVEAMKLMNEIESEYDGIVEAVLIGNGQMVEYGQPLFRIAQR